MQGFVAAMFLFALTVMPAASGQVQQGSVIANSAGQNAAQTSSENKTAATTPETKFEVADAMRRAILFTKYGLDVRLEMRDATMHARAIVTVKNEGAAPLDADSGDR